MKKIVFALLIFSIFFACKKSKNSKNNASSVVTSYQANLNIGGKVYNTSNSTVYNSSTSNYQWDGLNLYFDFPACIAHNIGEYYQVLIWDTAGGAITSQELLQFDAPGLKDFTNYYSPVADIYLLDTAYSGTAVVSGAITSNGNKTANGTFNLQGRVASIYSADSISFSASVTFTNATSY